MTPKEKATELYQKTWNMFPAQSAIHFDLKPFVKDCAIIAVDEMISVLDKITNPECALAVKWEKIHLQSVKQAIEKM